MESFGAGPEAAGEAGEWEVAWGNLVSIELKFLELSEGIVNLKHIVMAQSKGVRMVILEVSP